MPCPDKKPISEAQARLLGAAAGGKRTKATGLSEAEARDKLRGAKVKQLPEKTAGLFFETRDQSDEARFLRDLPGRDDGNFLEKSGQPAAAGMPVPPRGGSMTVGPTGGAMGGMGFRGAGMGGSTLGGVAYGAGEGAGEKSETTKKRESDEERLKKLLEQAGPGEERKAEGGEEKTSDDNTLLIKAPGGAIVIAKPSGYDALTPKQKAEFERQMLKMVKEGAARPSDWDADSGLPTGLHRPAREQPEPLEEGGERFHSTEAQGPDYGAGQGLQFQHGTVGSKMKMKATAGTQEKRASAPLYMGTSFEKRGYVGERGEEFGASIGKGVGYTGQRADEAVKAITRSPAAASLLTLGALLLGARGGKAGLKRIRAGIKKRRAAKLPKAAPIGIGAHLGEKIKGAGKSVSRYFEKTPT